MWTTVIHGIVEGSSQVFHKIRCLGIIVVVWCALIQNGVVSGFFDVSCSSGNEPQWVIVKTASDIRVPFFGEWLVLMISTAVFKLCGSDI